MALTISLMKGQGFWVCDPGAARDYHFVMEEVFLTKGFTLEGDDGAQFYCGPDDEVDICGAAKSQGDGVWVSDGHREIVGKARVVFDAPKHVKILRDDLYKQGVREAAAG
jgi:hypothetical protein